MSRSNWEEAAGQSKHKLAVSNAVTIEEKGMILQCEIIIGEGKQPWWTVQGSPGIKVRRALNREVDRISRWRPY